MGQQEKQLTTTPFLLKEGVQTICKYTHFHTDVHLHSSNKKFYFKCKFFVHQDLFFPLGCIMKKVPLNYPGEQNIIYKGTFPALHKIQSVYTENKADCNLSFAFLSCNFQTKYWLFYKKLMTFFTVYYKRKVCESIGVTWQRRLLEILRCICRGWGRLAVKKKHSCYHLGFSDSFTAT